jgi:peptidoglycan/xylan/chitin deacetylase (PgdA/CDA1 family)
MSHILREAPARLGLTRAWRAVHRHTVPVLMLHGVLPDADARPFNLTGKFISPEKLEVFLARIARMFKVMDMKALVEGISSNRKFENQLLITFDDGYQNVHDHAFLLLHRMGLPFTVFVTTGYVDTRALLWADMVEFAIFHAKKALLPRGILPVEHSLSAPRDRFAAAMLIKELLKRQPVDEAGRLVKSLFAQVDVDPEDPRLSAVRFLSSQGIKQMAAAGVTFGGHSVTHPILSRESRERTRVEVRQCKETLEKITQGPVTCFAYPNGRRGDFNTAVKHELAQAGYALAFTTIHGLYAPGDDPLEIKRVAVNSRWSYEEFETRTSGILRRLGRQRSPGGQ